MCGSSLISTPLEVLEKQKGLPAGIVLDDGRFQILNEIGRGGFGITYLAFFPEENKHVAIKECFPEDLVSRDLNNQVVPHSGCELEFQTILEDFNHEALILRQLQQLGIPKILWRIAENNTEYIVMEYIHGENLEQRIASKKLLNHFEAVKYLKNLLELLEKLHTNHLLHRDIKPANIVLTKDRAVLLDYGNVFKFTPSQRQKVTSRLLTPEYAPLEQFGENVILSPSTDLYALGATFYEAMTGIKPPTALERANGVSLKSIADLKPRIETT